MSDDDHEDLDEYIAGHQRFRLRRNQLWLWLTRLRRVSDLTHNGRFAKEFFMDIAKAFGPDNPRPWDPGHVSLRSPTAPHETRATLRLKQNGWDGDDIREVLLMKGSEVIRSLREGMEEEGIAHAAGRAIVGGTVPKGTV